MLLPNFIFVYIIGYVKIYVLRVIYIILSATYHSPCDKSIDIILSVIDKYLSNIFFAPSLVIK